MRAPLVVFIVFAIELNGQSVRFEELGRKALAAAQAGQYREAVLSYEEMLRLDPALKKVAAKPAAKKKVANGAAKK